jgi:hypothetical protein
VAKNIKKRERISILLRMSFKRRHKGAEGTNDRGKADLCGWFNAGGLSQEGSVRVRAKRVPACFVLLSNTAVP